MPHTDTPTEIKPTSRSFWGVLKQEHFAEEHRAAFRAAKRRVKKQQRHGDDGHHYCLFVDGIAVTYPDMDLNAAEHAMDRAIVNLMNGRRWCA
jgi:hypothetical protein